MANPRNHSSAEGLAVMRICKLKGHRARPYIVRTYVGNERKAFYFKTKREALEFKVLSLREPSLVERSTDREPKALWQFANEELARKKHELKYATQIKYSESIRLYIGPRLGHRDLMHIRRMHVEDFKSWLGSQEISAASKVFHFNFFKSLLKRAFEYELIPRNPAMGVRGFARPEPRDESWNENELQTFMQFHKDNPRLILYLIAASCALRIGEIYGLKKSDIDFAKGMILVSRAFDQKAKVLSSTKTKRRRYVHLPNDLAKYLSEFCAETRDEFLIPRDSMGMNDIKHAARTLRRDCNAAGVKPIRFHDLRHTWATLFVERTGNIRYAQKILGHSSLAMTERYVHSGADQINKYRNTLTLVPPPENEKAHECLSPTRRGAKFGGT